MSAPRPTALVGFSCGLLFGFVLLFRRRPPHPVSSDDPAVLLAWAQTEMYEAQAKNRARLAQAITHKNVLQNLVEQTQKDIDVFGAEAERARQENDERLAEKLEAEKASHESVLRVKRDGLREAETLVESAKSFTRAEERRIQAKMTRAMVLKAEWQQIQIANSISDAVTDIRTHSENATFQRAETRMTQEQERQKRREQLRQTIQNLLGEAANARKNGDDALAGRLAAECDALSKFLTPL